MKIPANRRLDILAIGEPLTEFTAEDTGSLGEVRHFRRGFGGDSSNLVVTASITLCQALTGCTITVPTIDKRQVNVSIDEVACHQYRASLKGEGLPSEDGKTRGDLIVECLPVFPAYLSAEQKRELKRVLGESN